MTAVSSMAGVGRGSSVTNRRRSGRESSANLVEVVGVVSSVALREAGIHRDRQGRAG